MATVIDASADRCSCRIVVRSCTALTFILRTENRLQQTSLILAQQCRIVRDMATTTAPSVSSGGSSQTIALAYAVAALQRGSDPLEARDLVHNSFFGEVRATDKKEPQMTSEQLPGSGTDSYDDRGSVTSSKSQNEVSGEDEEDAEKRLARSRERNREHARRTRLRKKAQLEALQSKVKGLEAERQTLRQQIEECSIASILLGLSSGEQDQATQNLLDSTGKSGVKSSKVALLAEGNRKRFVSDALGDKQPQPLKLHIGGRTAVIGGGKSHVNWKTGVYVDGAGVEQQLTPEELESLR